MCPIILSQSKIVYVSRLCCKTHPFCNLQIGPAIFAWTQSNKLTALVLLLSCFIDLSPGHIFNVLDRFWTLIQAVQQNKRCPVLRLIILPIIDFSQILLGFLKRPPFGLTVHQISIKLNHQNSRSLIINFVCAH